MNFEREPRGRKAIINAELFDGSGAAPFKADVVIEGNLIIAVAAAGELNLTGIPTYDAKGFALAPGFIDVHTHSDLTALVYPGCDSRVSQGVTTEIVGNCGGGSSVFLLDRSMRESAAKTLGEEPDWYDVRTYGQAVNRRRTAVNIGALAGHNNLRKVVMGTKNRPVPTPTEMAMMKELLAEALKQGAVGLSSGLYYMPGKFSRTEEVCELASVLRGTGKPYATHMRNEGSMLIEAIREAGVIARAGDGILQISHLKTQGPANWHLMDQALDEIRQLQASGLKVTADRYPYLYYGSGIQAPMPYRWSAIPNFRQYLIDNPDKAEEAANELDSGVELFSVAGDGVILRSAGFEGAKDMLGWSFSKIGEAWGMSPGHAFIKAIIDSPVMPAAVFRGMNMDNLKKVYAQDWVFPGSDGYSYPLNFTLKKEHPRCYGTFARFFRFACESAKPEQVIARMTSLPAKVFNLAYRGLVKPGYIADLTLFDKDNFNAKEDYSDPHAMAVGVKLVLVGGGIAFEGCDPCNRGRWGQFIGVPNKR